ncbi:AMP-binding protein [Alphaproteobacteria bacterium]|nr:AMP-binding protein [Alphaproteobacteria bacterium]
MNITNLTLQNKTIKIIADDNTVVNNQTLNDLVDKNTQVLLRNNVKNNNNIAIILNNSIDFIVSFFSVANISTSAPLNPNYTEDEYAFYFKDLKPKIIICNFEDTHPAILSAKKYKIKVIKIENLIFKDLVKNKKKKQKKNMISKANNSALILHTSGTTSKPKMVPLTHNNLIYSAKNIAKTLKLSKKDKNIILMPSFHIHGIVASILAPLVSGGQIVILPKFNALSFFKSLKKHSPTWFTGVPTMLQAILDRSPRNLGTISTSRLRFIRSSSASLPTSVLVEIEKTFKVPVIESYGMTEASHQMTSNLLPPKKRKIGSVGVPSGIKVKIVNDNFKNLKKNETGEILIKGNSVLKKYIASKEINENSFVKGWFRTGDLGYMDKDGYLFISGRIKEIINRGGEKISPKEIDEFFTSHKKINKAVSFAVRHQKLGEDIAIAIVLNNNARCTANELKEYAKNKLANFKIPKQFYFLKEIPVGATGKIQRIGLAKKLGIDQ